MPFVIDYNYVSKRLDVLLPFCVFRCVYVYLVIFRVQIFVTCDDRTEFETTGFMNS